MPFVFWPISPRRGPRMPIFATLGEFRGPGDGATYLHGATDIGTGREPDWFIWSTDPGLLVRESAATGGAPSPSAGGGGIRVGRFGIKHALIVHADPGNTPLPIYVIERGTTVYRPRPGIANPANNADFRPLNNLPNQAFDAYRKKGENDYELVRCWPIRLAIAKGIDPTDLHFIYYGTAAGSFDDTNRGNPLEVVEYENDVAPEMKDLLMTPHGDEAQVRVSFDNPDSAGIFLPADGGAQFKVHAYATLHRWWCGVYKLEYRIARAGGVEAEVDLPGGGATHDTGRLTTWQFTRLPGTAQSRLIVDSRRSEFTRPTDLANYAQDAKKTVYTLTHAKGMDNVTAANHWELESPAQWPDGEYTITVWAQTIRKSNGIGAAPDVHEVEYNAGFKVETVNQGARKVSVQRRFQRVT